MLHSVALQAHSVLSGLAQLCKMSCAFGMNLSHCRFALAPRGLIDLEPKLACAVRLDNWRHQQRSCQGNSLTRRPPNT